MKKLFLVVLVIFAHNAFAQKLSESEKEILMLQDQRSLGDGRLIAYLSNTDELLRYRAAIALANIQDTATVGMLLPSLRDVSPMVRSAAAFALGQIGSAKAEDSLLSSLKRETNPETFGRIAEALGKCGTEDALVTLAGLQLSRAVESERNKLVLAVSRFALRQIKTERAIWFCFDQLSSPEASVRWSALVGLWRAAPLRVIDIEIAKRAAELQKLVNDSSPDVRMHFATLLGKAKVDEATDLLQQLSTAEWKRSEWRVQVNTVRALGALVPTEPDHLPDFLAYLASKNDHVVVATLQITATLSPALIFGYAEKSKLEADLVALTNAVNRADMVRGEALVVLGRQFPTKVNANLLRDAGVSSRLKSKVIEALSYTPSVENFKLLAHYLEHDSVRVSMAAWDFFRRVANPSAISEYMKQDTTLKNVREQLHRKIQSALNRRDMAITTLVANTAGDTAFFALFKDTEFADKVLGELTASYRRLSSPDDTEAMQAVLDALGRIGSQAQVPLLEKALQDPDRTVALYAAAALQRITGKDYSKSVPQSSKPLYT
ncbi:MAG: HEAT repeat domain-containing protein, partial [Nitrososphaera sp.]|nr:HEAT repeat domain-containing protein [Nitrososphaera sp.]